VWNTSRCQHVTDTFGNAVSMPPAVRTLPHSALVVAVEDSDADRSHPADHVKGSVITTQIKAKLAADHLTSLGRIQVDADKAGEVWLSGTARTQEGIDKAMTISRETEGVRRVHSTLTVKKDD
jgi:hyperosmotically inducible protein